MTEVIVWSGWVGGLAVGAYALLQWIFSGNALGASTGFGNVCSYVSSAPFSIKANTKPPTTGACGS